MPDPRTIRVRSTKRLREHFTDRYGDAPPDLALVSTERQSGRVVYTYADGSTVRGSYTYGWTIQHSATT
jgi:hypothetical protein